MGEEEALRNLRTTDSFRSPWAGALLLHLKDLDDRFIVSTALYRVADIVGVPQLRSLPVELLRIVLHHARHSIFTRTVATIEAATHPKSVSRQVVPLNGIGFFERHKSVFLPRSSDLGRFLRITIDVEGIQKVERLSARPAFSTEASEHLAYVVKEDEALCNVNALIEVRPGLQHQQYLDSTSLGHFDVICLIIK